METLYCNIVLLKRSLGQKIDSFVSWTDGVRYLWVIRGLESLQELGFGFRSSSHEALKLGHVSVG
jgi:hypothetical protein